MIEAHGLTKRYGPTLAVDRLSFRVEPGRVTGFLGPNGAGKSTTMRMVLGLDAPSSGGATVGGRPYRSLRAPLRHVGALLDARATHGGRTARNHLLALARSNGLGARRADEVLDLVGLADVAGRRTNAFSLGMGQRLGLAAALLGDPEVLILDEPVNGLDTEGIRWIRGLMRRLATEGRTVFLSSHLMSEMELTADHLIVIGRGRLVADTGMRDVIERNSQAVTLVRSPEAGRLAAALAGHGARVEPDGDHADPVDPGDRWRVEGPDAATIGEVAAAQRIVLHELTPRLSSLEDVYTRLTETDVDHRASEAATR